MVSFLFTLICVLVLQAAIAIFTVSGVSSGGYMAVQMHVAFSSDVTGAAIIAAGPFYCSQGSVATALSACMSSPTMINASSLISYTDAQAASGQIDPTSNLQNSKVWIYSGTLDSRVDPGVPMALANYYQNYVNASNVVTQFDIKSEHAWITDHYGNECDKFSSPYLNNCGYDSAGVFLQHLYGTLNPKGAQVSGNLKTFDQTLYTTPETLMLSQGYIYLPTSCQTHPSVCKVHVAFNGCKMNLNSIGTDFVINSGLNEWAESNNLIIIYPQVASTLTNPYGCWDWWGYTGTDYALKSGLQMKAVYKMATQLPVSGIETWL